MTPLTRRRFLCHAAGAVGGGMVLGRALGEATRERPPNFIVMMADDLSADELGCYGHAEHRTPTLDGLAATGVRFETCYACPICHPSRFMIMTGQYGHHNGVYNFPERRGGPEPGSPEDDIARKRTFAHLLKDAGYATAMVGKWQLSGKIPTLVHEAGFDEYCMWAYRHNLPEGVEHTGTWEGKPDAKTGRYWGPSIVQNGTYRPPKADDYGPDVFTDYAIDFMRRHRDRPFLVYYPMALTHAPHYSTPHTTRTEADRTKHAPENWQANVEYADHITGRLVKALEQLGLRQNTVVFFTGDNGTGGRGKGQPTERGARVPMIVNGPGRVRPTGVCPALVDLSDILPTLAQLAGASVPADRPIDGHSFAHRLAELPGRDREWIYSYIGDRRILRDSRWLLEDNSPLHPGRLYDCGSCRDGSTYRDVTDADAPEVLAARARFAALLAQLPVPVLAEDGPAAALKSRKEAAKAALESASPWTAGALGDASLWRPQGKALRLDAGAGGLRLQTDATGQRGVAVSDGYYHLPEGAKTMRVTASGLTAQTTWMIKLAAREAVRSGGNAFAAHTTESGEAGTFDLPLDPEVLRRPGYPWTLKLGVTGPEGASVRFERIEFLP
ncbi:MAG: sulfatase-like hydrolase/transferase [Lentisphaeria bacterium]|nr:sulfatase-like hydrolase/transferase [Lentisphaeria bacterium]